MTNETDRITELEARIKHLEDYLSQFESFRIHTGKQDLAGTGPKKQSRVVAGKKRRGARLHEEWEPSSTLLGWARKEFPRVDLSIETDKFKDYWIARADRGAIKLDWDRTYRNWIRTANSHYRGKRETHQRTDTSSYSNAVRNAFD